MAGSTSKRQMNVIWLLIAWSMTSTISLLFFRLERTSRSFSSIYDTVHRPQKERVRVAIIFKTATIGQKDTCLCQRFVALLEGTIADEYDIILMIERGQQISPHLLEWLLQSKHSKRVKISRNPPSDRFTHDPKTKISFLMWAKRFRKKFNYTHYWFVEDDVYWTGKWGTFFRSNDERLSNGTFYDYVREYHVRQPIGNWRHAYTCKVDGHDCYDKDSDSIQQNANTVFRVSGRFLGYMSDLLYRDALHGQDEAIFGAALKIWNATVKPEPRPTHAQLFPNDSSKAATFHGFTTLGGWSVWREPPDQPVYSLRGLANIYNNSAIQAWSNEGMNRLREVAQRGMTKYKSNTDVPRNKIFHPVKCAADISVGEAALAFALEDQVATESFKQRMMDDYNLACPVAEGSSDAGGPTATYRWREHSL